MKLKKIIIMSTLFLGLMPIKARAVEEKPKYITNIMETKSVAKLPEGHFFENIEAKNNEFYVSDYPGQSIYKFDLEKKLKLFTKVPGHPVAIRFNEKNEALVSVHKTSILEDPNFVDYMQLYKMDLKGNLTLIKEFKEAKFLNGMVYLGNDDFLVGDAGRGIIYKVNLKTKKTEIYLKDEQLAKKDLKSNLPGINGLQKKGNVLYGTNSDRQTIIKINMTGKDAKNVKIIYKNLAADDIAIDDDENIYIATHQKEIMKLTKNGKLIKIAGKEQEAEGSTAVVLGNKVGDPGYLYAITDGGLFFGSNIGPRILRIKLKK